MKKFRKTKGVIACGHPLTADAGTQMFKAGGNAVDAAVAAAFMSCVAEVVLTGLWGGGFALVHSARTQKNQLFDFFVNMPGLGRKRVAKKDLDFRSIYADFRGALQEFHIGKGSVAVPGNILGLCKVHEMHGRLPLKEILAPAVQSSRKGFPMTSNQAFVSRILEPILTDTSGSRKIFAPKGHLLTKGKRLFMPDTARALEALALEGPQLFYQGELGQRLVRRMKSGGLITQKDLDNYRVMIRKPLKVNYRGESILMNPPPSSGGFLIRHSLRLLSGYHFKKYHFNSVEFLETFVSVMQKTNAMRDKREQKKLNLLGNTTHISVMDEEGNAVSLTTSHGSGAGFSIPGMGLAFNNMLGEQDLNPRGFHKHPVGKRLHSMMCPCIALKKGRPDIVLGSGGSNRLRTAILQALIKIIDFKMPLKKAVVGPRIHWEGGELNMEPGFSKKAVRKILEIEPCTAFWRDLNIFFGGVHTVMKNKGAGDPRRGGVFRRVS